MRAVGKTEAAPVGKTQPITAIYPGTFDPITNGHTDLVARASLLFDKVIVAIAASPSKTPVFPLDERVSLAKTALNANRNVVVEPFDNLLVEFAQQHSARVIVRGLRAVADFEFEFQLAGMNRNLAPSIETLFLMPAEHYIYLSSSLIREVAKLGGKVSDFVHPAVEAALRERLQ